MKTHKFYNNAFNFMKAQNIVLNKWQMQDIENDLQKIQAFNIDNYCKADLLFRFECHEGKYLYDYYTAVLVINETNEVYHLSDWGTKGKYHLRQAYYGYDDYSTHLNKYIYKEDKPNNIGVPTIKKIQSWVDYLHNEAKFKREVFETALQKNQEFANAFREKYPEAKFNTDSCGWCTFFEIKNGYFRFKFNANDNGGFYRSYDVINTPSNEDLLK
jgi:hypothetical protein